MDQQTKAALKNDQFLNTTEHGIEWANENRRQVIITGSAILAAILIVIACGAIYHSRSEAASTAFGAAMQAYQTPLASPGQQVPPGVKTYATVNDRAKAANELFNQVADKYSMTPDGKVARYFAGLTYLEEGQNQSAEDTLKKVASGWNKDLAALAKLSLAQLYRQTGRDAQAIDLYNELTAKPTTTVPGAPPSFNWPNSTPARTSPTRRARSTPPSRTRTPKAPPAPSPPRSSTLPLPSPSSNQPDIRNRSGLPPSSLLHRAQGGKPMQLNHPHDTHLVIVRLSPRQ